MTTVRCRSKHNLINLTNNVESLQDSHWFFFLLWFRCSGSRFQYHQPCIHNDASWEFWFNPISPWYEAIDDRRDATYDWTYGPRSDRPNAASELTPLVTYVHPSSKSILSARHSCSLLTMWRQAYRRRRRPDVNGSQPAQHPRSLPCRIVGEKCASVRQVGLHPLHCRSRLSWIIRSD